MFEMKFAVLLMPVCLLAQIGGNPGQYPPGQYPPGQYPPGQNPQSGGMGIPRFPKKGKKGEEKKADQAAPVLSSEGTLRAADAKGIVIDTEEKRILTFKLSDKTKFLRADKEIKGTDFRVGDRLAVDYNSDDEGYMYAVTVKFVKAGDAASIAQVSDGATGAIGSPVNAPAAAAAGENGDAPRQVAQQPATTMVPAAPQLTDGDEGPPTLRRGAPKPKKKKAEDDDITKVASASKPGGSLPKPDSRPDAKPYVPPVETLSREVTEPVNQPIPIVKPIDKAREAALNFTETLPNYLCKEFMTRYISTARPVSWQAQDVVSTDVLYEEGRERYGNVAINGKPFKKSIEELPNGSWSTGEFGTVLRDLFSPSTAASFHYRNEETIAGVPAMMYDYEVDKDNSHWKVMMVSQAYFPEYHGSVWIDKKTFRVLRVEMLARKIPKEFPLDSVESVTDYQYIRLGNADQFLLPVRAETLTCIRGTSTCSRNTIEFRNYHKYSGESTVTFDK